VTHTLTLSEIHKHHDHLIRDIRVGYDELIAADDDETLIDIRDRYVRFLETELGPHALTEEETIYADGLNEKDLHALVDGMKDEHLRLIGLINELRTAPSSTHIVAAAGGFMAMLAAHFDKENRLLLPALNERGMLPD
jgi:hemerythrin-like domain-containing protein